MPSTTPVAKTVALRSEDLHAWEVLRPLLSLGGYLPWSSGAMRPAGLVDVCNEIVLGNRSQVVELGSGASTTLLARLLRTRGGRLVAIEHDEAWARIVTEQLRGEDLRATATVVHAPLEPDPAAPDDLPWYSPAAIDDGLAEVAPIDLLIVDGPPAYVPGLELARLPALPQLMARLAPGALVVLDDIERDGEQEVLGRWERETDFRFERLSSGIAIGRAVA